MTLLTTPVRRAMRRHVHLFRWAGDSPYGTVYACRCGDVRPGL
ncbi:hypothetical protein [Blastococcus xanthinilyticus]|nr:hypothetical protein [Blastococcus xanthinilyticus]